MHNCSRKKTVGLEMKKNFFADINNSCLAHGVPVPLAEQLISPANLIMLLRY